MVEYLSGNRIQGSSTLTSSPPQTSWKEIGRATAGSGGSSSLTTSAFTAKDNIMILYNSFGSDPYMRVGTGGTIDTTQKYTQRYSENGGSDGTNLQGSTHGLLCYVNGGAGATGSAGVFGVAEGINHASHKKRLKGSKRSQRDLSSDIRDTDVEKRDLNKSFAETYDAQISQEILIRKNFK